MGSIQSLSLRCRISRTRSRSLRPFSALTFAIAGLCEAPAMSSLARLSSRLHRDQRGAVSLETILIIGAIALPILIFIIKFGWPKIRDYFNTGVDSLKSETDKVQNNQ